MTNDSSSATHGEVQRRLAAIVSADVVGYSRLMGRDESGTLARLKELRASLLDPLIANHGGRIVKTMGDGLLLEFPSIVNAVACCKAMQTGVERQRANSCAEAMRFRIGVHLGDVIADGEDVFGDGVNLAARLQEAAEPGGIAVSENSYSYLDEAAAAGFSRLGEREFKNIRTPVGVWHWKDTTSAETVEDRSLQKRDLSNKPAIAVLPFDNMSGDAEQGYFADGITEDIITNLSYIRWLYVIARNSSFAYKNRAIDVRKVANELGVRYVLEGSVRKAGSRVRITAQLIDANTSAHLWASRYDRDLTDIFSVQDEITRSVVAAIEPEILAAEGLRARNRSQHDIDAWDLVMRALSIFWRLNKKDAFEAIGQLEEAVKQFPDYGPAHSMLAFALTFGGHMGWHPLASVREKAGELATIAIALDDRDAWAHIALGYLHSLNREGNRAIAEFSLAAELNPNFALAYGYRGFTLAHSGRSEEALSDIELAISLSPKEAQNALFVTAAGVAHYLAGQYNEAAACAEEGIRIRPGFIAGHRVRCAALAKAGRVAEARAALAQVLALQPDANATLLRQSLPYTTPELLEEFVDGLIIAGLPD